MAASWATPLTARVIICELIYGSHPCGSKSCIQVNMSHFCLMFSAKTVLPTSSSSSKMKERRNKSFCLGLFFFPLFGRMACREKISVSKQGRTLKTHHKMDSFLLTTMMLEAIPIQIMTMVLIFMLH